MPIYTTTSSTNDYMPHPKNDETRNESVHYLRRSTGNWTTLRTGMVIAEPQEGIVGDGLGDDQVYVLAGVAEVHSSDGETLTLRAGDFISIPKGVATTWNIKETFHGLFTYVE
jgi:uncharacterized cupin superfamily protein